MHGSAPKMAHALDCDIICHLHRSDRHILALVNES
jgi:hypothetical protein